MTDRLKAPNSIALEPQITGSKRDHEAHSRLIAELLETLRAAGYECDLDVMGAELN